MTPDSRRFDRSDINYINNECLTDYEDLLWEQSIKEFEAQKRPPQRSGPKEKLLQNSSNFIFHKTMPNDYTVFKLYVKMFFLLKAKIDKK